MIDLEIQIPSKWLLGNVSCCSNCDTIILMCNKIIVEGSFLLYIVFVQGPVLT